MGSLRRYISSGGATFAWPLSAEPLQEARDRHVVTGAPGVCNSPYGRALSLDGAADYVTLGASWEDQTRFDAGTLDFSIVTWIRRGVTGTTHTIFDKRDADNDGWELLIFSNDQIIFSLGVTDASTGPNSFTSLDWTCLIATVDRDTAMTIYVNGQQVGTTPNPGGAAMATTTIPRIGAHSFNAINNFQGDIAGIVIFPRVLSPAECLGMTGAGGGPF